MGLFRRWQLQAPGRIGSDDPGEGRGLAGGDGSGRVHIDTQSGGIRVRTKDLHESKARGRAEIVPVKDVRPHGANPFYLI